LLLLYGDDIVSIMSQSLMSIMFDDDGSIMHDDGDDDDDDDSTLGFRTAKNSDKTA